jgi:hypothetical protein
VALFWLSIIGFEAMVVLQGLTAWCDEFLTPAQMQRSGVREGLPFMAHGGMWGDIIFISPLVATIIAIYGPEWSPGSVATAVILGGIASGAMHETYKKGPFPEAHVQYGRLTTAGQIHRWYMALAFAALILYYTSVSYTPWMWLVSALLVLHTIAGTHVILGLLCPKWYPGRPLHNPQTWGVIGGTAALVFGCTALRAFLS